MSALAMGRTTQNQRDEWLLAFQALAMEWCGQCLSTEYINQSTKLLFRCADGYEWSAMPSNVYHKRSWCPHCEGNAKLSIQDAREAAAVDVGHLWRVKPQKFKEGQRCPDRRWGIR